MNEIWSYGRGFCKGYSEDFDLIKKISRWKDVEMCGTYYKHLKLIGQDFIFPINLKPKISMIMGDV